MPSAISTRFNRAQPHHMKMEPTTHANAKRQISGESVMTIVAVPTPNPPDHNAEKTNL